MLALGGLPEGDFALISVLQALSVWSFMCSWNALNDYLDLEIDRVNRPDRPLPSGAISEASAKRGIALMMTLSVSRSQALLRLRAARWGELRDGTHH